MSNTSLCKLSNTALKQIIENVRWRTMSLAIRLFEQGTFATGCELVTGGLYIESAGVYLAEQRHLSLEPWPPMMQGAGTMKDTLVGALAVYGAPYAARDWQSEPEQLALASETLEELWEQLPHRRSRRKRLTSQDKGWLRDLGITA